MPNVVLIVSCPQDTHTHAMCEAIERRGATAQVLYTPDFPERLGLTIRPMRGGASLSLHRAATKLQVNCDSVWLRRPLFPKIPMDFEEADRVTIERECLKMRESFLELLCPTAFLGEPPSWPPRRKARSAHGGVALRPQNTCDSR
jgi:hypothetical protein